MSHIQEMFVIRYAARVLIHCKLNQMPTKSLAHNQFLLFLSARFVFRECSAIFRENFSYVRLHRCNQILLYESLKDYGESNARKGGFLLVLLIVPV